jgi:DnaJ-class molecular chaperone
MIRIKNVTECIPNAFVKLNMRPATLVKIVAKIVGAEVELAELTLQQSNLVWGEMQKRLQAKESSKQLDYWKANNLCPRCGGAGQADKWIATGKVCFRCEGSGKYFG